MKYFLLLFLAAWIVGFTIFPTISLARVTPEDIINSKKEAYDKVAAKYSLLSKQKLEGLSKEIVQINKQRTDELDQIMVVQAAILDEYERRTNGKDIEGIKKARYWITYAHEAVAYQAAKIYVFELNGEGRIKSDATSTVNLFQLELSSTRLKVINSQKILEEVVSKNEN